jgi:sterol desaturase/sphingolipid hydroxylase (fatty acid hydroxylase superfamily)
MRSAVRETLPWLVWWTVMGGFMAATLALAAGAPPTPALVFGLTVANTLFVGVAEQLLPRRPEANLLRDPQTPRDLGHGLSIAFVARPLAAGSSLALVAAVGPALPALRVWPGEVGLPAQVALALLTWSFANYWLHRGFHALPLLWRFHAIHHDADQMHLFKAGRVHMGEEFIRYVLVPTPMLLLGVPTEVLVWMGLWNLYEGNLAHSNLDQRFPRIAQRVFNTLPVHFLHHGAAPAHQHANFAGVTPLWDQLFGTFLHPDDHPVDRVGLSGASLAPGFLGQLLSPFRVPVAPRTESS